MIAVEAVFVGVFERQRHQIGETTRIQEYPGGERWAFALCGKPAWEPDDACRKVARHWPPCDDCARITSS